MCSLKYSLWGQKLERELNRIDPDPAPARRFDAQDVIAALAEAPLILVASFWRMLPSQPRALPSTLPGRRIVHPTQASARQSRLVWKLFICSFH
jgi:hypothetical protein